ncbi:E3 ubiquitin-protein ligase TRIM32-like isoform X1 [Portunus trituberculatus]|uniref:E3 ubiquitin-protein ligase TRIM32-like isoform X1 n=1 Tax=Portunus trituberculatus TaxID=210409 RepID=UPI001E1D103A|nr:E3 ubiquitin-protein ligase TRIM32-like isoform X1 [Portunus trituberculatus]
MAEALPEEAWAEERCVGVGDRHGQEEEPLEAAVICPICLKEYDAEFRRPLLLSSCGHTFCRSCVKNLVCDKATIVCPCCRHEYKDAEVDNFPVNFSIQILASSTKNQQKMKLPSAHECQDHGVRVAFWCRSCEVPACGECLFDGHPRPTHAICKINDVIKEVKTRAEELVKESREETAGLLGDLLSRVVRGISDLQEAGHILQESGRLRRIAQDSKTLSSITRAFESAKSVKQRVQALRNCEEADTRLEERPVVVALSETGGLSKVKVEEKGIHIYSLRPSSTAYTVAIKMSVLLECVSKDHPEVFLDLRAGERPLGRVYITLWGHMRRAQQFMALCLGTYGRPIGIQYGRRKWKQGKCVEWEATMRGNSGLCLQFACVKTLTVSSEPRLEW